jgi:hypothetical protein
MQGSFLRSEFQVPLQVPPLTHAILKVRLLQILDAFPPHVNAISLKGKSILP